TGARNIISANGLAGVELFSSATNNLVAGNYIGTDVTGTGALGNSSDGVYIQGSNNTVGGTVPGPGNTIAFNGHDGVLVDMGTGDAIRGNSIFSNGNLGIELFRGGNSMQPAPTLTRLTATTIQVSLSGTPSTTYRFDIFSNTVCDPSGFGEGATPLVYDMP